LHPTTLFTSVFITTRNSPIRGDTISVDKKSMLIVDFQRWLSKSTISVDNIVDANCLAKCTISVDVVVDPNVSLLIMWLEILPRTGGEIATTFLY